MKMPIVMALLVAGAVPFLCGCEVMMKISDGSLRNATATGAAGELRHLGYRPAGALRCVTPDSNTRSLVRVDCSGRTSRHERIQVTGVARDADTSRPRESYVITVGGHEVLRKPCLDLGCRHTR